MPDGPINICHICSPELESSIPKNVVNITPVIGYKKNTLSLNRFHHSDIRRILINTWSIRVIDLPTIQYEKIAVINKNIFKTMIDFFLVTEIVKKDKPIVRNE